MHGNARTVMQVSKQGLRASKQREGATLVVGMLLVGMLLVGMLLLACGNRSPLHAGFGGEGGASAGGSAHAAQGLGGASTISNGTQGRAAAALAVSGVGVTGMAVSTVGLGGSGPSAATGVSVSSSGVGASNGAGGGSAGVPGGESLNQPFLREHREREPPPFIRTNTGPPEPAGTEVSVTIHGYPSGYVSPALFGNNVAVWNGDDALLNKTMHRRLSDVNVSILRFPGGTTSDTYHFDGVYPAHAVAQGWDVMSEDWAVSTAEFMSAVRTIGATPLITVNHGYATYDTTESDGSVENAAALAANWVEYCNSPNDGTNPNGGVDWAARRASDGFDEPFSVAYWEVGNEAYGSWEVGYDPTGSVYAANFLVIVSAMKAVDPEIAVGLVAPADAEYEDWTRTVLAHPGVLDLTDFLVVHNYFGYISEPSQLEPTSMLARTALVGKYKERLDHLLREAGLGAGELPLYLGEYNLPLPTHSYQIAHLSGVFIADVLGQLALTGWAGASLWNVQNEYDSGVGLGAGDHGFLTRGHPDVVDFTPRPSYLPFYFFTRNFGDFMLPSRGSPEGVSVYASAWRANVIGIVAVNKTSADVNLELSFIDAPELTHGNVWLLHAPEADLLTTFLNGVGNGLPAGGPDPTSVPPFTINVDGAPRLALPAYSVVSIVLYE